MSDVKLKTRLRKVIKHFGLPMVAHRLGLTSTRTIQRWMATDLPAHKTSYIRTAIETLEDEVE